MSRSSGRDGHPGLTLVALVVAWCGFGMQGILVAPVLPLFAEEYDQPLSTASYVLTSALLTAAISVAIAGRLADRFGKQRVLLVAMALLAIGGLIAAATPDFTLLLLGRSLQGAAAAALPLGVGLVRDLHAPERVHRDTSLLGASIGLTGGFGLVLAGVLVGATGDLGLLLWVSASYSVLAFLGVLLVVPESPARRAAPLDLGGAVTLGVGLLGLLLGLSQGATWGWTSLATIALFLVAVVSLTAWTRIELGAPDPLVDVRLMVRPALVSTGLATFAIGFAQLAGTVGIAGFVQADPDQTGYGFAATVLVAGLFLFPAAIVQFGMAFVAVRLMAAWRSSRGPVVLGCVIGAVGFAGLALWNGEAWQILAFSLVFSVGIGMGFAILPPRLVESVPAEQLTAASGVNALVLTVSQTIAGAILGALLSAFTLDDATTPSSTGYALLFAASAVLLVAATGIFTLLTRPRETVGVPV